MTEEEESFHIRQNLVNMSHRYYTVDKQNSQHGGYFKTWASVRKAQNGTSWLLPAPLTCPKYVKSSKKSPHLKAFPSAGLSRGGRKTRPPKTNRERGETSRRGRVAPRHRHIRFPVAKKKLDIKNKDIIKT